jgi:hypothetical protein
VDNDNHNLIETIDDLTAELRNVRLGLGGEGVLNCYFYYFMNDNNELEQGRVNNRFNNNEKKLNDSVLTNI